MPQCVTFLLAQTIQSIQLLNKTNYHINNISTKNFVILSDILVKINRKSIGVFQYS